MDEKQIKNLWQFMTNHPYQFFSMLILIIGICWGFSHFLYSETISSKNTVIETKDSTIETKNLRINDLSDRIKEKDDTIQDLRNEILKDNIKTNALSISIQNKNPQSSKNQWNWSCTEKDIIIEEFADKITEQDNSLKLAKNTIQELNGTINELSQQIPAYETGFIGKDIKVSKGSTYQADGGKFTLAVTNTEAISNLNRYRVSFILNNIGYTKSLGQSVTFTYVDGFNYTLNVRGTGNPAKFFIYKNE